MTKDKPLPRACRADHTKKNRGIKMRSVRGYRRRLDDPTQQAIKGKILWSDVRAAAAAIKASAEMLMSEQLLSHSAGGDQEVEDHPLGELGGLEDFQAATPHRKKKIKVKKGVDKRGAVIDEVSQVAHIRNHRRQAAHHRFHHRQ